VWADQFRRLTGSDNSVMPRALFVADCVQRGDDPLWASATFKGADIDGSGYINLHEYLLSRAAIVYQPERDSGTPLVEMRLRIAFHFYDQDGDGLISSDELAEMVRDLAAGDKHVALLLDRLHPLANDTAPTAAAAPCPPAGAAGTNEPVGPLLAKKRGVIEPAPGDVFFGPGAAAATPHMPAGGAASSRSLTLAGFLATALPALHSAELSSRDLLRQPVRIVRQRTVLEPRTVVAGVVMPGTLGFRQSSQTGGGAVDPAQRPPAAVNDGLVLHPALASDCGWRGALLCTAGDGAVVRLAGFVVDRARRLTRDLEALDARGRGAARRDDEWMPGGRALWELVGSSDRPVALRRFQALAADCRRVVEAQPAVVRVRAPAKVFGDVHGQLRDLLALFAAFGFTGHRDGGDVESVSYVFNGDIVDRGAHQLEVVALVFALKVAYPTRIWIVRGNHEFRWMNAIGTRGFLSQCNALFPPLVAATAPAAGSQPEARAKPVARGMRRGGNAMADIDEEDEADEREDASPRNGGKDGDEEKDFALSPPVVSPPAESPFYVAAHGVFRWLPLAALVGPAGAEPVLVLHGGCGDGSWTVEDLMRDVPRPLDDDSDAPRCVSHALWSDPSDSDADMMRGVHGSPRGEGAITFGPDVTERFCTASRILLVVRSHQWVQHGYKVMHSGRLVTVFSARNYEGCVNDSAILLIANDDDGNLRVRPKRLLQLRGQQRDSGGVGDGDCDGDFDA